MFTYAILKNEVLGIDERLRKTFSTAIFATLGAILLLVGTEIAETYTGFGSLGGIVIGLPLIILRKPIYATINGFSNRLMPESFTKEEESYLEAYSTVMDDFTVTEGERRLLELTAKNLGLNDERVEYLEGWYDTSINSEEE